MKLKDDWKLTPRLSKLATALYPSQADAKMRREVERRLRIEGWRKLEPEKFLPDAIRGAVSPLDGRAPQKRKQS